MNFLQPIKRLFSTQEPVAWVRELDLRRNRNEGQRPLTVSQLHAVLNEAMAQGLGDTPVELELEYVEGQLCGSHATTFQSVTIEPCWWQMRKDGQAVHLRPSSGLVYVGPGTLEEVAHAQAARGIPS
jgi:hypothetical protein